MNSSVSMKRSEVLWSSRWADLGGPPPVLCLGLFGPLYERLEFMAIGGKTSVAKGVESAESRHRICTPSARARLLTRTGFDLWDERWAMGWATVAGGLCSITEPVNDV